MKLSKWTILAVPVLSICGSWADHPDTQDHKLTDLLLKLADLQSIPDSKKTEEQKEKENKLCATLLSLIKEEKEKRNEDIR